MMRGEVSIDFKPERLWFVIILDHAGLLRL